MASQETLDECRQQQSDELEVLESILGDTVALISREPTRVQVTIANPDEASELPPSLVAEFTFPPSYPVEAAPLFSVDVFSNRQFMAKAHCDKIAEAAAQLLEANIGAPVVFTVVEWLKESYAELVPAAGGRQAP